MSSPRLRFPEFCGDWKPSKLGDAFTQSKAKGEAGLPIYSVTLDRGLVPRDSLIRKMAADAADDLNLRAKPGDIVYNMMRMWQGAVGVAQQDCMVSPAYVVASPKGNTSSKFFDFWFQNKRMLYLLWAYSHGLTNDRLRLYYSDFSRIPLRLPEPEEQKKIAAFLSAVDTKLVALQKKTAALTEFKIGLMQKIFSKDLRFKRDDGSEFPDWNSQLLGCIGDVYGGLSGKTASDFGEGLPYVTYRQIFEDDTVDLTRTALVKIGKAEKQNIVAKGDVLVTTSSETPKEVGFSSVVLTEPKALYLNSFCFGFRPKATTLLPEFSRYLFQGPEYRRAVIKLAQGSTRYNISKKGFLRIKLNIPHRDEQSKISEALCAVDDVIEAHKGKIEDLQRFKKGLLQQLFV